MAVQEGQMQLGERLKDNLLKAWQVGHGGGAETVHLLQGEDGLALVIPKGLLQAEIEVTRKAGAGSRLIHNYVRELLQLVSTDLVEQVEAFTQKRIEQVIPLVDLRAGWIMAFFRFEMKHSKSDPGS